MPEYNKWRLENAAKNKDMTVPEYKEWVLENTAKNKGMTVPEYKEWVLENNIENNALLENTDIYLQQEDEIDWLLDQIEESGKLLGDDIDWMQDKH